ncbi:MAG: hypothetical protein COB14_03075 [Alphaproteobacteria bacterium]|nr:MAG: hypothetical protein COB14_03075 [Alphaproteobacteria bacterium]
MMKYRYKRRILLLAACVPVAALGFFLADSSGVFVTQTHTEVVIRDFSAGTHVAYEILADGVVVGQGQEDLEEGSVLNLPLPVVAEDTGSVTYRLHLKAPEEMQEDGSPAETLDLLLALNRDTGNVSVSGSGVNKFSDILVRKGDKSSLMTADWAGLFHSDALDNNDVGEDLGAKYNQRIELAFQNSGIDGDFNRFGSGKVDVQFGDSSDSDRADVRRRYSWALREMSEELSVVMVMQTKVIGMFFDARAQLKTQRKHQELKARAHKDYHPSDQMCRIGTFMRSIAHTESKAELNKHALNKMLMNQYLATTGNSADHGPEESQFAKLYSYSEYYCDPRDNDGATSGICPQVSAPTVVRRDQFNKDVDYARMVAGRLTIDVDFSDGATRGTADNDLVNDEAAIIALAKNLYFPNVFEMPEKDVLRDDTRSHYSSRSFAAKMNVAHSSFLNIVGMKSSAPVGQSTTATATTPPIPAQMATPRVPTPPILAEDAGWAYMKAMLREFGIVGIDVNNDGDVTDAVDLTVEEQITEILGERPSYYAQMEILTKKIYQHPNFYTNLYDKPANVDRIGASIDAITLMNQRDRFESLLRREMLTSLLIEEGLEKHVVDVSANIYEGMQKAQEKLN